ncbi:MAG: DUF2569 family protein, partial [Cyclobacteriaceae bacterium]|nr:DUF2569 family protein [Cyclobacteriaceae bacterium]
MEDKLLDFETKNSGKPIGGWLWLILVMMVANGLQIVISLVTIVSQLLSDDWALYFQTTDELLKTRINIYFYLIISMAIGIGLVIWSILIFFQRKKNFPAIFLGLLGYFILTEILRIYFLDYYARLANQEFANTENSLFKMGIVAIIAGLYLNK